MNNVPCDTAMDANVVPSSVFTASLWNSFPGATTVVTPSSLRK
jgi:hypothetical protein